MFIVCYFRFNVVLAWVSVFTHGFVILCVYVCVCVCSGLFYGWYFGFFGGGFSFGLTILVYWTPEDGSSPKIRFD
jgi:hypothetical protein